MQYISLIVSMLFLIALGFSIYDKDWENALFQIIIALIQFICFLIFQGDNKRNQEFISWVRSNRKDIGTIQLRYNGILIDEDTEFLQYEVCLSLGFLSFRRKTGYYIKDYHPTPIINLLCTTFSLVFGWWSLPMGPINTIRVIGYNIFSKPKRLEIIKNELK